MSVIIINGNELELNLLDADILEKYEKLNSEIVQKINEKSQYENISTADGMRKQCRYVDEFFDKLFGDGTAEKIFGGGNDLKIRLEAFSQVSSAGNNVRSEIDTISSKYGAGRVVNREQRRQQQKHKPRPHKRK